MNDAMIVRECQRLAHRPDDLHRILESQTGKARLKQNIVQCVSAQVLHNEVNQAAFAVEIEDTDNVWMRQGLCPPGLALQSDEGRRMLPKGMCQQLNGDVRMAVAGFLPAQIESLEYPSHPAAAEFGFQDETVTNDIANADGARGQRRTFIVAQRHLRLPPPCAQSPGDISACRYDRSTFHES
jgi:hypothetical protein